MLELPARDAHIYVINISKNVSMGTEVSVFVMRNLIERTLRIDELGMLFASSIADMQIGFIRRKLDTRFSSRRKIQVTKNNAETITSTVVGKSLDFPQARRDSIDLILADSEVVDDEKSSPPRTAA